MSRILVSVLIVSFSLFLIACDGGDNGGNGNRRAGLIDTSGVRQFAMGDGHACAVLKTGKLMCWGWNSYGQLGNNEADTYSTIPVEVKLPEGSRARMVAVGNQYSCAILDDDSLKCWGQGDKGKLGNGDKRGRTIPTDVNLGENRTAKSIATGYNHTCAILDDDSLKCWGHNSENQLGQGLSDTTDRNSPTEVNLGSGKKARAVGVGQSYTCAILMDGSLKCWGSNFSGALGDGSTERRGTPTSVNLGDGRTAKAISLSISDFSAFRHTCALLDDNSVKCWGSNGRGQLGSGDNADKTVPTAVDLGEGRSATAISSGESHTCALLDDNSVVCWGFNELGQVGDETIINRNTPTPVDTGTGTVVSIGTGGYSSCALFDDGSLACWGNNSIGQLGTGEEPFNTTPQNLDTKGYVFTSIDGGRRHTCARYKNADSDVAFECWGNNTYGQLTNNTMDNRILISVNSPFGNNVEKFSTGSNHTCAILTTTNALVCVGYNALGQLGDGSNVNRSTSSPVNLGENKTARAVSAGFVHTCAILNDDKVKCWGEGSSGELGNSANNDSNTPVSVTLGDNTAKKISAGGSHTCAILNDYSVACWGNNIVGQLGVGDNTARNEPTGVNLGTSRTATGISTGNNHTCALLDDKSVVCWGFNGNGALGDRSISHRTGPVAVPLGTGRTATAIHAKADHSCAILDDGSLLCWGKNTSGQLGNGTSTEPVTDTPVAVDLGAGRTAMKVGGGANHTCAILDDESVKCWGDNYFGQAGVPTSHRGDQAGEMGENLKFVKFEKEEEKPLPEITLAMGDGHMCALDEEGALSCWGWNDNRQLGAMNSGSQDCVDTGGFNRKCHQNPP